MEIAKKFDEPKYFELLHYLFEYGKEHLTSEAVASNFISEL